MKRTVAHIAPYFVHLFTMALWGGGALISKDAYRFISPARLLFFRFAIGAAVLLLLSVRSLRRLTRRELWLSAVCGAVMTAAFLLDMYGLKYTTPAKNGFLIDSLWFFVPLILLLFFRKLPSCRQALCIAVAAVGLVLVSFWGSELTLAVGDLLSFCSGFFYALNAVLFERFFRKDRPLVAFTALQFTATALLLYPATAIADGFSLAMPPETLRSLLPVVLYMSLGASVLGWGLRNYVLTHLDARHYSVLAALGPVVTSAMSAIFGFETLGWHFLVGAVLITGAVILDTLWTTPPPPKAEEKGRPHDLYEG